MKKSQNVLETRETESEKMKKKQKSKSDKNEKKENGKKNCTENVIEEYKLNLRKTKIFCKKQQFIEKKRYQPRRLKFLCYML